MNILIMIAKASILMLVAVGCFTSSYIILGGFVNYRNMRKKLNESIDEVNSIKQEKGEDDSKKDTI